MNIEIEDLMMTSGVKFGTSGARGLVSQMNDQVVYAYTQAFLKHLSECGYLGNQRRLAIAGDLRPSSPQIMQAVAQAGLDLGFEILYCGFIPSPALVLYSMHRQVPSIMVTGSHIPDDRNGIKFHRPDGEIDKTDETAIKSSLVTLDESLFDSKGQLISRPVLGPELVEAQDLYTQRWVDFYGATSLSGLRIGVYQHSTVGRDIMVRIMEALGAQVTALARSEKFIPVDTEAIRPEDQALAKEWCAEGQYDALISADGDCDRPLLSDETGEWLRGDVLGILAASFLGADGVATPVSCNTALEKSELFKSIRRTQIGSPYVIAGMQDLSHRGMFQVVGYEANGGFLQWSKIYKEGVALESLPTRDPMVGIISCIVSAREQGMKLSQLVETLPQRFTLSDRLQEVPTEDSQRLLTLFQTGRVSADLENFNQVFSDLGSPAKDLNDQDGLRFTLENSNIVHIRPSGNAPELRCYVESDSPALAQDLLNQAFDILKQKMAELK